MRKRWSRRIQEKGGGRDVEGEKRWAAAAFERMMLSL